MTKLLRWSVCALLAAGAWACTGTVTDPGGTEPDPDGPRPPVGNDVPIACDGPEVPVIAPLARVGADEYVRGLEALLGDAVVAGLDSELANLPPDEPVTEGGFRRLDRRVSERHVDTFYAVADAVATRIATDATLRTELVGSCASAGIDAACMSAFVPELLRRALRRPPTADDVDAAMALVAEYPGTDGLHAVLFTTLMAPDFVYRFENRGTVAGDVITLTDHELAARLSYHFWGSPPDAELLAAADDGLLSTEAGYLEQVDRLYADPRTDAMAMTFFEEWLHVERGEYGSNPRLEVLRDGVDVSGLGAEMAQELRDLLAHHIEGGLTWTDVLTSPHSFARQDRLAGIYGVAAWDGVSEPPLLPADERSGLLTRAGMLYTSDGSTNPFRRGIFIRRNILCDSVPPPPDELPADALQPPELEAGASTRDAYAAKITVEPCASCHAGFSPIGYTLEAYDGLGRFRAREHVVSATGEDFGMVDVDAVAVAAVDADDETPVAGPVELTRRIADSDKPNECFARMYFRFTHRRDETADDGCTVGALATRLDEGASIQDALRSVALSPTFRQRQLED